MFLTKREHFKNLILPYYEMMQRAFVIVGSLTTLSCAQLSLLLILLQVPLD